jgi:aryl-alcohol dehydrogenase-like predicted oxidoreductase
MGGGDWSFGWGEQNDHESLATVRRAVELGVNWIDTAAVYGLGHAETIVAQALRDVRREQRPLVFTKCGLPWKKSGKVVHRLKADSIRRELEESLRRLEVERIDLYQIHWPIYPPDQDAPDIEEAWETLASLRREGKLRHIGVSNFDVSQLERIRPTALPGSLQPPYSIVRRELETEILPYCERVGIGVIVYSPLQSGLLTGKMTRERIEALPDNDWRKTRSDEFYEPKLSRTLQIVERLRELGERHGRSPAEMAVAWTLRHSAVTGAIVGARRPGQVDEIVRAADVSITDEEWSVLDES